jgi:chemotaxis protein histidine kinase CheA
VEILNFPIVALGTALICLIGVTIYAVMQRGGIRSRDEQLVVARAQAYAMLELSQAGVLFLDREHKIMGEASAAAPELLGHTCGTGTAFVQAIAELVDVGLRRAAVAHLESLWQAEATAIIDATTNPLQKVHSGSRHLAIRFSRLVVDGRVHHIIVSIERISAPRAVPQTIEVPVLDEETFARRLAGETGARPGLDPAVVQALAASELPPEPRVAPLVEPLPADDDPSTTASRAADEALGPLDVTEDSLPQISLPPAKGPNNLVNLVKQAMFEESGVRPVESADKTQRIRALESSLPTNVRAEVSPAAVTLPAPGDGASHLATTITSAEVAGAATRKPTRFEIAAIIDPSDSRRAAVLDEILPIDGARLEAFLEEAREKAGQLRAIIKLPAREPQAFREKLVLILELIRGVHSRAERLPLQSVCDRANKFEAALGKLRDKHNLSGNDFLPLAVKLDDLLSHLAIQGEVAVRVRDWRDANGEIVSEAPPSDATMRSATATGTTIRQPKLPTDIATTGAHKGPAQKTARLSDLSPESLTEMAQFLADIYSKRVSLVVVGLEDVPGGYRKTIEKILGQLIHNAIRHGVETPADRAVQDKPELGTVAVQFARVGADGYQLSVQDDGRGLDHELIRAEAIRQGVLTRESAAKIDPRKLASLIFRPGFTTVGEGGARGIGMDVVRDLVTKAGGRVGIATKPGEYTRFRITLPHEKKDSNAQVA